MREEMQDQEEIWFDNEGVSLFAVQGGSGPPVVLLHGGLGNHLACRDFAVPLSARFRVIKPDPRGSGKSIHAGPLTWDQLADDIAALMLHLDMTQAVIGGVSFGAGCAVRFALRHPHLTAGLLVLTPAHGGDEIGMTREQREAFRAMDAAGSRVIDEGLQVLYPSSIRCPIRSEPGPWPWSTVSIRRAWRRPRDLWPRRCNRSQPAPR